MFVNTNLFKTEADHFLKYGYYCPDPPGSFGYKTYWEEQLRRCSEGHSVGGMRITGDHYFYLNFSRILLTKEINSNEAVTKNKKKLKTGIKTVSFPDFWDGDYYYFDACEKARAEGLHVCVAKSRRRGYSFKNSAKCVNAYNTIRKSTSIIGAFDKKYLYPEGAMTMVRDYLDFLNQHTAWAKRRQKVDRQDHVKASFIENIDGRMIEKGYLSQIMGLTFANNPSAARGKSPYLVLFEEAGTFDNLMDSYMATLPSVEDGGVVTGQIIVFGTGGEMDKGTLDFEKLFYDPSTYEMFPFENIWDEGANGTFCGYFHPVYTNKVGYMDKDGNSKVEEAKQSEEDRRLRIKTTAKDPKAIDKYVSEYPFSPSETFLRSNHNILPVTLLNEWLNRLQSTGLFRDIGVCGRISYEDSGPVFKPDSNCRPLYDFPLKDSQDVSGCVVMYQAPDKDESGKVPFGTYILVNDPYSHGGEYSVSLGASYVIKLLNKKSKPDDMIVASYIGKPGNQDDYNYNMFALAELYNAGIGFENDRGDVVGYARRKGKTHMLLEEVEIINPRESINIRRLGRIYGTSMGSKERKNQALVWYRDWLLRPRGKDENGNTRYNLHMIYDPALLKESIMYGDGNYDRVSAMLVAMFYMQDLYALPVEPPENHPSMDPIFSRQWF